MEKEKVILFTMKGCPHCDKLKNKLIENKIQFVEKDVDKYEKTYDQFSKAVKSDYLPAILIGKRAFVPDKSFKSINEASIIIKKYLSEQAYRENRLD